MAQRLPVNDFKQVEDISDFNEDFIKSHNNESDQGYFLEVIVQYPKKLHNRHNDFLFLPEGMKIEKFKKLIANLHDKEEYVIHIRNLKQSLNHGFVLKKVHRIIKINQKSWLKPCIHMNTDPRKRARNDF